MKAWLILVFSILLLPTIGSAQITSTFGVDSRSELPSGYIKALIWNIHAGEDVNFRSDYHQLAKDSHLLLMQEVDLNSSLQSTLEDTELYFTHAKSYISPLSGNKKGVATASVSKPSTTRALRSSVVEFGATTPKAVLVQLYKLSDRKDSLLVVNVHAINFVTNEMFYQHIDQIIKAIKFHKGPALVAGDFNTWNKSRLRYLDNQMNKQNIERVKFNGGRSSFPNIGRWFGVEIGGEFDQVYTRGIKVRFKEIHSSITSSDHKPIEIHFSIL
ncbi:MAG: hypothetical protein COW01_11530 [Bdellovibrionales bacterium CG12_big_fil_rev_8_21_14_0_65_38_15]|nr:MAG: hypothetical protein COW79_11560 [Bdellovibrionales bacterium CG22_combo_CG10-13_8_21_14_all_38_13]PIQ54242.1 MAG: hypothetical protein COW01_11530 [Bdellovibrionales bacterium CG12_big_fil_rev_8_21_14_0_65_38_15]PIR29298.1 MAG: hypothetical protein COV38_11175 [Bdellovibrionales bacterium CG11_big_fil_rev_8_21_14_0_20_38_13]